MVNITKSPYILTIKKVKNNNNISFLNKKINKNTNNTENIKNKKKFSPLSGSELKYEPELWNKNNLTKTSHNCYSYALGKIVKGLSSKAQPGYGSAFNHINDDNFTCESFKKRLKKDSPGSYIESFDKQCIPGFYKIFLALDISEDYHWWRQDDNKYWSHKPGSTNVVNIDASGNKIIEPLKSNRNFTHRNYKTPCFYACVYSDLTRSLNTIYNI
jgi:hypothetical protein